jgi:hypothetical protein
MSSYTIRRRDKSGGWIGMRYIRIDGEIRLLKSDHSVAFGSLMIDQPVATESRYPPSIVLENDSYGGAIRLHDAFW